MSAEADGPLGLASNEGLGAWQPIETAPKGSGEDGPGVVTHPDYVAPPTLLLWTAEGMAVGSYDWYYHEGYGLGAAPGEPAWRQALSYEPIYGPTHWMPLPPPPQAASDAPNVGANRIDPVRRGNSG